MRLDDKSLINDQSVPYKNNNAFTIMIMFATNIVIFQFTDTDNKY